MIKKITLYYWPAVYVYSLYYGREHNNNIIDSRSKRYSYGNERYLYGIKYAYIIYQNYNNT